MCIYDKILTNQKTKQVKKNDASYVNLPVTYCSSKTQIQNIAPRSMHRIDRGVFHVHWGVVFLY
jgi:hypothetical protein